MSTLAIRQPFRVRCVETGEQSLLILAFKLEDDYRPCTAISRWRWSSSTTRPWLSRSLGRSSAWRTRFTWPEDLQYTLSVAGPSSYIQDVYRRLLRAPQASDREAIRYACETTPLGRVRARRLTFAGGDISLPLMTLANSPSLGDLLRLRLSNSWPPSHSALNCDPRRPGRIPRSRQLEEESSRSCSGYRFSS